MVRTWEVMVAVQKVGVCINEDPTQSDCLEMLCAQIYRGVVFMDGNRRYSTSGAFVLVIRHDNGKD
jgi:hypothetical protein